MTYYARMALVGAATGLAGCGDPLEVREPPTDLQVTALMIIDPSLGSQPLFLQHPAVAGADVTASVVSGDALVADTANIGANTETEMLPCDYVGVVSVEEGVRGVPARCLNLRFVAEYGREYTVSMTAEGLQSAQARTIVPANFTILSHAVTGDAMDGISVSASWTRSAGAFRYVVAVSPVREFTCTPIRGDGIVCPPIRWFGVTEDTTLSATIGPELFRSPYPPQGPWAVTIYAVTKDLYAYVFTGATSDFFPVPPGQNIVGGRGAIGAWVRRSILTDYGLTLERVAEGIRITNQMDTEARYMMIASVNGVSFGPSDYCDRPGNPPCAVLAPGASRVAPLAEVLRIAPETRFISVLLFDAGTARDPSPIVFPL